MEDDNMILFFTGTGNSRYIARRIADSLGDELLNMNERIKAWDTSEISANGRLVFVVPTYGWRIPRIVEKWIDETPFSGSFKVWFVMDCGGEIGDALLVGGNTGGGDGVLRRVRTFPAAPAEQQHGGDDDDGQEHQQGEQLRFRDLCGHNYHGLIPPILFLGWYNL